MTPEQFCYWLQGFAEITGASQLSEEEWMIITDHLKLVFEKKTPTRTFSEGDKKEYERFLREYNKTVPSPYDVLFPPKVTC